MGELLKAIDRNPQAEKLKSQAQAAYQEINSSIFLSEEDIPPVRNKQKKLLEIVPSYKKIVDLSDRLQAALQDSAISTTDKIDIPLTKKLLEAHRLWKIINYEVKDLRVKNLSYEHNLEAYALKQKQKEERMEEMSKEMLLGRSKEGRDSMYALSQHWIHNIAEKEDVRLESDKDRNLLEKQEEEIKGILAQRINSLIQSS